MQMHIGSEIKRVLEQKGKKLNWLAEQINTSRRNMYDILDREEISTGQLVEISKALNYDFFKLYITELNGVSEPGEIYHTKRREKIHITVELDGLQTTLERWITRLTAINSIL